MKRFTIMLIPGDSRNTRQMSVPHSWMKFIPVVGLIGFLGFGFLTFDYVHLRAIRRDYMKATQENEALKGEARVLMGNLDEVKQSLRRVQDYSSKLSEMTNLTVQKVSKQTGIGPLSSKEAEQARKSEIVEAKPTNYMPLGINMDSLSFKPVFERLSSISDAANTQAYSLQHLLSTLSKHKSLLSSVPATTPVRGWITSGFGARISPFTGERSVHKGIDVASPPGTAILAPADGVVIFTGAKDGFGNFIMIAHGFGVVTGYGHNAQNMVQIGQRVARGEQIGTVGMTGRTTGPHVHYEVFLNGQNVDPKRFILDMTDDFNFY